MIRRLTSAGVLALQLVLAVRGFLWMPVPMAAPMHASATVCTSDHGMPMAPDASMGSDAAMMAAMHHESSDCTPPSTPCHDVGGCHAGAPCCAPTLATANLVALSAPSLIELTPSRPRTAIDRVAHRIGARRLPPATAPPART